MSVNKIMATILPNSCSFSVNLLVKNVCTVEKDSVKNIRIFFRYVKTYQPAHLSRAWSLVRSDDYVR